MDNIDRKILAILQQDATVSVARISERIGLSITPCVRRIKRLEASGVILQRVALLAPEKLGLGLTAFVWSSAATILPNGRTNLPAPSSRYRA